MPHLKLTDPRSSGGAITFSGYGTTSSIATPSAAESIDGSTIGL